MARSYQPGGSRGRKWEEEENFELEESYSLLDFMTVRTRHTCHLRQLDVYWQTKFFMGVALREASELKKDML